MKNFLINWLLPLFLAVIFSVVIFNVLEVKIRKNHSNLYINDIGKESLFLSVAPKNINRGDLLLVKVKDNQEKLALRRCVGLPGDSIKFNNSRLIVNGKIVDGKSAKLSFSKYFSDSRLFPYSKLIRWNKANYGIFLIPWSGQKIILNERNLLIYKYLIENVENNHVEFRSGKYYVNGQQSDIYTFKNDYYFLYTDKIDDISDSRLLGPITKNDIESKFVLKLF